ncbi:DUF3857 domain-containing protein [Yeosuana sp. AK3]
MVIKNIFSFLLLFTSLTSVSQETFYSSLTIPENLTKNANAVVRYNNVEVSLLSVNEINIKENKIVTILNKYGDESIDFSVNYDNNVKIKNLEVLIFNKFGEELKKIKKNDFKDVSAVDGGTLYSDSRIKYFEYTPLDYPYTVKFYSEIVSANTAYIPSFSPIENYLVSVEKSEYTLSYPANIIIRKKENNFENFDLQRHENSGKVNYNVQDLEAIKYEDFSPFFKNITPSILFSTNEFSYEGVYAHVDDWNELGKWFNDNLLVGRATVSEETKNLITELVADVVSPIEKAKIVYKYVQENTRYISVQVGIGGMQPIAASDVDLVKYGDCKGLSNYTKSLLNLVGVQANYTRLYASSSDQVGVDKDFVSFLGQTNHVILNIPNGNDEDIWLECTSQKTPFGFLGDFTDNRDVLVITPEGGKIKHTKKYTTNENQQVTKGSFTVLNDGSIDLQSVIVSKGIQYDDKYWIETQTERDLDLYYKKRWNYINNLVFNKKEILNNKDSIQFKETITFSATNYSKNVGDRMLFNVNAINRNTEVPDRYRDRKLPLKIYRGFKDVDNFEIYLPEDYKIESLPKNVEIENKFGHYSFEITTISENTIRYNRQFIVNDGEFPKEDYEAFRNFYKEVSKLDNSKIALIKKPL